MATAPKFSLVLGERGRIVLPAQLRRALGLQAGDRLILSVSSDGELRLIPARQLAHQLQGMFSDVAPGRSLADELIAERRAEAQAEADAT